MTLVTPASLAAEAVANYRAFSRFSGLFGQRSYVELGHMYSGPPIGLTFLPHDLRLAAFQSSLIVAQSSAARSSSSMNARGDHDFGFLFRVSGPTALLTLEQNVLGVGFPGFYKVLEDEVTRIILDFANAYIRNAVLAIRSNWNVLLNPGVFRGQLAWIRLEFP